MAKVGVIGIPGGWSSLRLIEALKRRTGFDLLVDMSRLRCDMDSGSATFEGVDLTTLDALIIKKVGAHYSPDLLNRLALLRYVASRGPRIFSRPAHIKRVLDRLSCTVTLQSGGIPIPPTVVTEDLDAAADAIRRFGRAILKPLYTSKARGMTVVNAADNLPDVLSRFREQGNSTIYVQKMLNLPGRDLGLAFLGGKFLGCYARVGHDDSWNTTTHSGGRYEPHQPAAAIVELAHRAQSLFELDFTCVDVAETEVGPVVFEVSAFGGFRGLLQTCNIDAAQHYADYVLNQLNGEGK